MSPRIALLIAALALSGCSQRNSILPGDYTAHAGAAAGVKVTVDAQKREVTFAAAGAAPVKRSAQRWADDRWPTLCPRGLEDTASEVLDLGPAPLLVGALNVERPILVAQCLGKPIVELTSLGADGQPVKPMAASFER